jgi:hypothetical protein
MEKLSDMPELSTGSTVLIAFIVMAVLVIAWGVYSAPTMTEEEEEWDRYYDEMYKSRSSAPLRHHNKKETEL